ncbi:MAG: LysR family transcriptional regulator [Rhodospirillales bacterium]|nr:LysR family transcriptional regulator [Rhodospirillales bacterium]
MRFDLADLHLFLHVSDAGSITHGAERAHLALASASARILGMEQALGVPLLKRGRRGISLTAAGGCLADHARVIVANVQRMKGDLGAFAREQRGTIRLLSNTAALMEHLPKLIASFLAQHPGIDVEIEERESEDIVAAIASGGADIGLASTVALSEAVDSFPFRADSLVLVVPRSDALSERRHVRFQDVLDRDFVGLARTSALQRHLNRHAASHGARLNFRIRVNSFDDVCRMVAEKVGLGIVSETSARRCRRSMAIRALPISETWAKRQLAICVRRYRRLPMPVQRLVEHLRESSAE